MPASKHLKVLSVRLPESEVRRFKSLAASRGISVQDAVHQALEAWERSVPPARLASLDELQGSLADADFDLEQYKREERELEFEKERRWL